MVYECFGKLVLRGLFLVEAAPREGSFFECFPTSHNAGLKPIQLPNNAQTKETSVIYKFNGAFFLPVLRSPIPISLLPDASSKNPALDPFVFVFLIKKTVPF